MSYSESKDGQVILTMSREDYQKLLLMLGTATGSTVRAPFGGDRMPMYDLHESLKFLNRLNQGNPHYTPYQVEAKKS